MNTPAENKRQGNHESTAKHFRFSVGDFLMKQQRTTG
jgi:hypothetical protein